MSEKMRDALVAYRYVQRKMLEKWSEGDERVKADLWAALHKCEALADAALAEQPTQPDGQCSYCRTYNGHQDGCIYAPPAPKDSN